MQRKLAEPTMMDAKVADMGRPRAGGGSTRDPGPSHTSEHRRADHDDKAHLATDHRRMDERKGT